MRPDYYTPPLESISLRANSLLASTEDDQEDRDADLRTLGPFCPKCGTPRKQRQPFCRYCRYSFVKHV
jgi:hypothetical protein